MKTSVAINKGQLELLKFVAKYRFVTSYHVQKQFAYKSRNSVNNKLKRLVDAGFLGMKYDNAKKLSGIPASYYLTPKGLREVQQQLTYITDAIIKNAYGDKNASESLIQESAELFELAQSLTATYPNLKALTARQLGDLEYFPRPLPDLYLAHKQEEETHRFFLYQFRDVKRYDVAVNSAIARLIKYREAETYAESGNEFPIVLFVCATAAIERHAQRVMKSALNKSYEPILVYTTSFQALSQQKNIDQAIWSSIEDPDTLLTLEEVES